MNSFKNLSLIIALLVASITLKAQNPLIIPEALSGTTFNLTLQEGSVEFTPGITTQSMGVNGPLLGPTLIFQQGDQVDIYVDNQLPDTTTIHWHGMHVPSVMDGGPHTPIAPGTTWNPHFTILDHASTMWYHPHLMHKTNTHVQKGIAGFIIIQDDEEAALDLPRTYGVDDIPLVFQTKTIDANGQIDIDMANSGLDTLVLTNGTVDAFFDAPAQLVRLRLLNGASERSFNLGFSNNANFKVIGTDGGLLTAPAPLYRLLLSPGERYEVLVDLTGMEGQSIQLMNFGSSIPAGVYGTSTITGTSSVNPIPHYDVNPLNGSDFPLLTLNIGAQTANPITTIPTALVANNEWEYTTIDNERTILMVPVGGMGGPGGLNGPFQLNGSVFDMDVINEVVDLNATEVWTITNQSFISHPFHIHDVQFNIQEIDGGLPPPYMRGWKDVVLVNSMMTSVKFVTRFEDFADPVTPFMYHCHILTHEDGGMMGQFTVVDPGSVVETVHNELFSLYPNPTSSTLRVILKNSENAEVQIIDLTGKTMFKGLVSNTETTLDVSDLSSGIYFIKVAGEIERFVKQ